MAYTKVAGVDVLVKVKKAEGTMVAVGGQTGASLSRSAETIDVTDKTSNGWASSIAGVKSWSVDADGFVTLGDEAMELLEKAFDERKPVELEIRMGGNDDANGVTYTGSAFITDFPLDFSQDSAVTYTLAFSSASPLVRTKGTVSVLAEASAKAVKK